MLDSSSRKVATQANHIFASLKIELYLAMPWHILAIAWEVLIVCIRPKKVKLLSSFGKVTFSLTQHTGSSNKILAFRLAPCCGLLVDCVFTSYQEPLKRGFIMLPERFLLAQQDGKHSHSMRLKRHQSKIICIEPSFKRTQTPVASPFANLSSAVSSLQAAVKIPVFLLRSSSSNSSSG